MDIVKHFPIMYECAIAQLLSRNLTLSDVYYRGCTFDYNNNMWVISGNRVSPLSVIVEGKSGMGDIAIDIIQLFSNEIEAFPHIKVVYENSLLPFFEGFGGVMPPKETFKTARANKNHELKLFLANLGAHFSSKYFAYNLVYDKEIISKYYKI